ncbi:MAG TPA: acyltransferase [Rhodocyclaceae bacterium]|nr:acyltransferase [Rhodocyclaceae bacterium]
MEQQHVEQSLATEAIYDECVPAERSAAEAHADFLAQRRFGSLDGLRALSIAAVIWHHSAPVWVSNALLKAGTQGVTLFFAISGFLITTLMLRERRRSGSIDLGAFYMRRALRIFPLYYLTLLIYVVVVAALERHSEFGETFFRNLPYFATYTSNIFVPLDGRVIFYFSWSLAAEEQFYLLWPPILKRCSNRVAAVLLFVLVSICIVGHLYRNLFLVSVPLAILSGALLALALDEPRVFSRLYPIFKSPWCMASAILMLIASLATQQPWGFFNSLLCVVVVACCVVREQHPLASLLALKPVAYIGSISYGMYLLHMLSKNLVVKLLHLASLPTEGLHVFVLTLMMTILVAGFVFRHFESFFLTLKSRYTR